MKLSFVIYVNFEGILKKISSFENSPEIPHMTEIIQYTACSFTFFVKFTHDTSKIK